MNAYIISGFQLTRPNSTPLPLRVVFGNTEAEARNRWLHNRSADCRIIECHQLPGETALMYHVKAMASTASPAKLRAMLAAGQAGGAQ